MYRVVGLGMQGLSIKGYRIEEEGKSEKRMIVAEKFQKLAESGKIEGVEAIKLTDGGVVYRGIEYWNLPISVVKGEGRSIKEIKGIHLGRQGARVII